MANARAKTVVARLPGGAALRRAFRVAVRKQLLPTMPVVTLPPEDNVREIFHDLPRSGGNYRRANVAGAVG